MNEELTDLQIKAQTTILDDDRRRRHGIEIVEDNGTIILKGSVPSQKLWRITSVIIRRTQGATRVKNDLEVEEIHEILERVPR